MSSCYKKKNKWISNFILPLPLSDQTLRHREWWMMEDCRGWWAYYRRTDGRYLWSLIPTILILIVRCSRIHYRQGQRLDQEQRQQQAGNFKNCNSKAVNQHKISTNVSFHHHRQISYKKHKRIWNIYLFILFIKKTTLLLLHPGNLELFSFFFLIKKKMSVRLSLSFFFNKLFSFCFKIHSISLYIYI